MKIALPKSALLSVERLRALLTEPEFGLLEPCNRQPTWGAQRRAALWLSAMSALLGVAISGGDNGASAQPKAKGKQATVAPLTLPPLPTANPRREQPSTPATAAATTAPTLTPGATNEPSSASTSVEAADRAGQTAASQSSTLPPVALPAPATPEAEYMAKLDLLIAPVRDYVPNVEDGQRLKEAMRLQTIDAAGARQVRSQITDPAIRRLAEWLGLRAGIGEPLEFSAFLAAHPSWPDRQTLLKRAEEQLFTQGGSAQKIFAYFKDEDPKTGAGYAALASAHLAAKDEVKAREIAAKAWRELELASSLEAGFLERFGSVLTPADHRRRLDRILVDEVRFGAERNDRAAIVRRLMPLLPETEHKTIEARIAIFLRAKLAGQMLAALPPMADGEPVDWGLAYQKVQHYRRVGQFEEAWKILLAAPTDAETIISPDDWWVERRAAAYEALRAGKPQLAYDLVRDAGPLSVNPLKDQTFLAGWIALRYLDKKDETLRLFEASRAAADGPLSQARADYWWGRALEAAGRADEAKLKYAAAAAQADTFHGQLGRQKLSATGPVDIRSRLPALPTAEEAKRFNAMEAVKAAVAVAKVGLDRSIKVALFGQLRNYLKSEGEMAMLAHLAGALGDPQTSLRVGKTGISRGMNLVLYAYPIHAFPGYTPLRDPPEPAMLLGIARQETEFNNTIVSSAGARGLLQVMPITAQHICRDHKIKCDLGRLLTDNSYNAMIASAYIGDRMAEFRGNYVLTLAGYNAGPGRARQWIREFGDPRDPGIDPIDWIERIPIEETRDYVKKVLANVQVYRARLGDEAALRLEQDLVRTIGGRRAAAPSDRKSAQAQ